MPKVSPGNPLPKLDLVDIYGESIQLPSPKHRFTHLQFRRFAGCPICNLHLQAFATAHEKLATAGIQEIVFFHSTTEALLNHNTELPFPVVADADKTHYRKFGVESSLLSVLHPKAMWSAMRGVLGKGLGLSLKNGPLGLPADILLDPGNTVVAVKYGTHAYDQWSVEELLEYADQVNVSTSPSRSK